MSNDISKAIDAIANASGGALGKAIKEVAPPRSAPTRPVRAATYESPKTIPQRSSNYTVAKFPVKSWEERLKEAGRDLNKPYTLNSTDKVNLMDEPVVKGMDFRAWLAACCLPPLILGLDPDYAWASCLFTQKSRDAHRRPAK